MTQPTGRIGRDGGARGNLDDDELVSVLVVDDQASFRTVMRDVIAASPGFRLAAEASSGEAAIEAVGRFSPKLVIMDKRMPGMDGVASCRAITERYPDVVVLLCSVEDPDPDLVRDCGASRMIRKQDLAPRAIGEVWRDVDLDRSGC